MTDRNAALEAARIERRRSNWRGGVLVPRRQTIRELEDELERKLRRDLAEKAVPEAYRAMCRMVSQAHERLDAGLTPNREHALAIKETMRLGGYSNAPAASAEDGLMGMTLPELTALVAKYEAEEQEEKARNAAIEGEVIAQAIEDLI